jgi:hypothetical protein
VKVTLDRIILYGHRGEQREIRFAANRMNIITGESKTGKSAIIHIVDYCFGSENCYVPDGVIRRKVAWYAIVLRRDDECLFIARQNPDPGRLSNAYMHTRPVKAGELPLPDTFAKNADPAGTREMLARYVGIEENLHVPSDGQSRDPLSATFSHARIFCFQDQSLIDNKNQLFFNQSDGFVNQAIKDTLPYFLGAVSPLELMRQRELTQLRREARLVGRQLQSQVTWEESAAERGNSLLSEAREVGLLPIDQRASTTARTFELLREALGRSLPELTDASVEGAELAELQAERNTLRIDFEQLRSRFDEAKAFGSNRDVYEEELEQQRARLELANVFPKAAGDHANCPLCQSEIASPTATLLGLESELGEVSERITSLRGKNPRLQTYLSELSKQIDEVGARLRENQQQQNALVREVDTLRLKQGENVQRSHVQGRISAFLETPTVQDIDDLKSRLAVIEARIQRLVRDLSGESYEDRLSNLDYILSEYMTAYAKELDLEHSDGRTRLDLRRLTVVAETRRHGSIRLENMGSGDNWVGCHVLTHMALHRLFRERDRPVPAILILDQPSKAHYPPDVDDTSRVDDDDRIAVRRLFKFIHDRTAEGGFQSIVIDHADEPEQWFKDAVIQRWRGGDKLVPDDWLERPSPST